MKPALLKTFANPPSEYRGAPFWAWNGDLEPAELRRQVRLMHEMGLGGFFMHSRVGLATPYLSDRWFACIDACIDEAEKLGMKAWLYDEDRWPSGAAGGLVTKDPKHRMVALVATECRTRREVTWDRDTLAVFAVKVKDGVATASKRLTKTSIPPRARPGEVFLAFRVTPSGLSSWYNGYTYLDTLSHDAVKQFIKTTHETYRKRCGKHFGRTVPGIFTDEPNYGHGFHGEGGTSLPWTRALPAVFRKRYGYDLLPHLVELLYEAQDGEESRARYHFYDCLTHLFVDAFSRQIGEWCDKHKMEHTGHVLMEDSLRSQTEVVGNCMRFYEYMQAPGMDLLTERWRIYDTAKQVSSAARQFGRRWRLTETYGCTGWDFPFLGHKALGDWQAALGINLRCQHLAWYTMEGQAKRDYPAAIFYQSPWWTLYRKVEDYFARLHTVLSHGSEVRDLLVIHPIESAWLLHTPGHHRGGDMAALQQGLDEVRETLLGANLDYDYGDEELLSRHGRVKKAADGPQLQMGKATYRAVLVPPVQTLRASTVDLLARFQARGGQVVFAGPAPDRVDARASDAARDLARACTRTARRGARLVAALEETVRRVSITDASGTEIEPVLYQLREDRDAFTLFVCNTGFTPRKGKPIPLARDRKDAFPRVYVRGFAGCQGTPYALNPETGAAEGVEALRHGEGWEIVTALPALGSRLFVIPKQRSARAPALAPALKRVRRSTLNPKRWAVSLAEPNVLVLDRPRYRIGGGRWQQPEEILRIDQKVRAALGIPPRGGRMVQPWAREQPKTLRRTPVELEYRFSAKALPSGGLLLGVERPETFTFHLNGTPVSPEQDCGHWTDRSLRTLRLDPATLRCETNVLRLTCDYAETHSGLEIVYLLGNFGVRVDGTAVEMTKPVEALRLGDWVRQGLPFYSGSLSYRKTLRPRLKQGERLFVVVPEYRGAAVRVLVDGEEAGVIAWEPNEIELTERVPGSGAAVELALEVIGTRRNSHGPLHLTERWPAWTGPGQFASAGAGWTDGYTLVPAGLLKPPRLEVRR